MKRYLTKFDYKFPSGVTVNCTMQMLLGDGVSKLLFNTLNVEDHTGTITYDNIQDHELDIRDTANMCAEVMDECDDYES